MERYVDGADVMCSLNDILRNCMERLDPAFGRVRKYKDANKRLE